MRDHNDRAINLVNGELCARERSSPKIATIEQWTDAFILFMNIYVGAHPNKIHQLLKYIHSIRLGASRFSGQGWILYDDQFRLKKHQIQLVHGVRWIQSCGCCICRIPSPRQCVKPVKIATKGDAMILLSKVPAMTLDVGAHIL